MSKVSVLDSNKRVLEPCHPAHARILLSEGKASVFKRFPFTIILKHEVPNPCTGEYTLSLDPGSRCTGVAITDAEQQIVALFELHHRGGAIKSALSTRSDFRRSRRTRRLRSRPARWANRSRKAPVLENGIWKYKSHPCVDNSKKWNPSSKGWIPPSLMSRVFNINTWVQRLRKLYPITKLAVEHVKFDTQLLDNPEIKGVEYQQGTLFEREVKEYLLEKFKRKCFYCGVKNVPFEKEHIIPKKRGGTNRVSNLTISCIPCNKKKGNRLPHEIDGKLSERVQEALKAAKKPMRDAAAVNIIRWKIVETLEATGLPLIYGTGGKTKHYRREAGLPKEHYYDAACVAGVPKVEGKHSVLAIHAVGYGHRRDLGDYQTVQTAPGFKRPYTRTMHAHGFQRLDMVEIRTAKKGKFVGCINCFDKTPPNKAEFMHKCRVKTDWTVKDGRVSGNTLQLTAIQKRDGYAYQIGKAQDPGEPPKTNNEVLTPTAPRRGAETARNCPAVWHLASG